MWGHCYKSSANCTQQFEVQATASIVGADHHYVAGGFLPFFCLKAQLEVYKTHLP